MKSLKGKRIFRSAIDHIDFFDLLIILYKHFDHSLALLLILQYFRINL